MAKNTVKNTESILRVRNLYEQEGLSLKGVAHKMGYSINTVRKIVRHVYGYEGDSFNKEDRWKNVGRQRAEINYISNIDGEALTIQKGGTKDGYLRISKFRYRETLHTYEAKKVYRLLNREWSSRNIVHHVDNNKTHCASDNLSIFASHSLHRNYHGRLERLMYQYLLDTELLAEFYKKNPEMQLKTLKDFLSMEF